MHKSFLSTKETIDDQAIRMARNTDPQRSPVFSPSDAQQTPVFPNRSKQGQSPAFYRLRSKSVNSRRNYSQHRRNMRSPSRERDLYRGHSRVPNNYRDQNISAIRSSARVSTLRALAQLNQKQISPTCDVFAAKGYDAAVQVPSPAPPHPSTRRVVQLKSNIINLLLVSGVFPRGQAQTSSAVDPSFFPKCFLFSRSLFFVFQLLPLLCLQLRFNIASSFSVKMQARTLFRPFHKDED
ncbi:hypothetical protein GWK47_035930 [Chionoecetes opilio]|uniref:Uncharacterized protein n=1 Tax=Chionoecetes opilio TaxID=41210 RepID=A0A8J5CZX8_CHIOP|nr:hypothetical protein GWK47_035930 [Chionoecetes opilio]